LLAEPRVVDLRTHETCLVGRVGELAEMQHLLLRVSAEEEDVDEVGLC